MINGEFREGIKGGTYKRYDSSSNCKKEKDVCVWLDAKSDENLCFYKLISKKKGKRPPLYRILLRPKIFHTPLIMIMILVFHNN